MPTCADLMADHPNLRQQYDDWRAARAQNGEDLTDYQAFRQHVIALGRPDPGEPEIDDVVGDDFKAAHPERYGSACAEPLGLRRAAPDLAMVRLLTSRGAQAP